MFLGKLGIDLERKLVIHDEKDPDVWRSPKVDSDELREARKYGTPERKVNKCCPNVWSAKLFILIK